MIILANLVWIIANALWGKSVIMITVGVITLIASINQIAPQEMPHSVSITSVSPVKRILIAPILKMLHFAIMIFKNVLIAPLIVNALM